MKAVLEIIKRFLFEIIVVAVAAGAVAMIVVGLGRMGNVQSAMQQSVSVASSLRSMGGDVVNRKVVEQSQRRVDLLLANHRRMMDFARERSPVTPLVDVFPESQDPAKRKAFQEAYRAEVASWRKRLNACGLPTQNDVDRELQLMSEERAVNVIGAVVEDTDEERSGRAAQTRSTEDQALAEKRAAVRLARQHYCYVTGNAFQDSEVSRPGGPMWQATPPSMEDMWHAQLEVWVQSSVVDALAAINNAAAEALKAEKRSPWIGNLPIKELVSLQMTTYYVTEGERSSNTSTAERAYPPGSSEVVFTQRVSNDLYELLQFSVRLIVDARDLPVVVAGLCNQNFHTPLAVSYKQVEMPDVAGGRVYGEEPVVEVTIDFETVMLSAFYLPLMPDSILESLNKRRPEPEGSGT
jgi:hypothetical protein